MPEVESLLFMSPVLAAGALLAFGLYWDSVQIRAQAIRRERRADAVQETITNARREEGLRGSHTPAGEETEPAEVKRM